MNCSQSLRIFENTPVQKLALIFLLNPAFILTQTARGKRVGKTQFPRLGRAVSEASVLNRGFSQ